MPEAIQYPELAPDPPREASGPLAGTCVLELGSIIAGPLAGRMLADLGAEVIKVESPKHPDPMRDWGQGSIAGRKLWWPVIARNKKLVTIDLAHDAGRELFLDLVSGADAVVENFRPGTLEKWKLGYERLREANPGLVLVRISGYGQEGPYAARPGFAAAAEALSGLRYVNGYPGEVPPRSGISLGDSLASLFAVQGLLAALLRRGPSGEGEVVDVSILGACLALTESMAPEYDLLGAVRQPSGARLEGIAPSGVFVTGDEKRIVIAANMDSLFRRLAGAMGRPELAEDPRYATSIARGENQLELEQLIQDWVGEHSAAELDSRLAEAGVVCAPVATIADVFANPHVQATGMLAEHEDPEVGRFRAPGVFPSFSAGTEGVRWTGPWEPGAHNQEVFAGGLGRSAQELDRLREEGVL